MVIMMKPTPTQWSTMSLSLQLENYMRARIRWNLRHTSVYLTKVTRGAIWRSSQHLLQVQGKAPTKQRQGSHVCLWPLTTRWWSKREGEHSWRALMAAKGLRQRLQRGQETRDLGLLVKRHNKLGTGVSLLEECKLKRVNSSPIEISPGTKDHRGRWSIRSWIN